LGAEATSIADDPFSTKNECRGNSVLVQQRAHLCLTAWCQVMMNSIHHRKEEKSHGTFSLYMLKARLRYYLNYQLNETSVIIFENYTKSSYLWHFKNGNRELPWKTQTKEVDYCSKKPDMTFELIWARQRKCKLLLNLKCCWRGAPSGFRRIETESRTYIKPHKNIKLTIAMCFLKILMECVTYPVILYLTQNICIHLQILRPTTTNTASICL
jgi:hypothetical protein